MREANDKFGLETSLPERTRLPPWRSRIWQALKTNWTVRGKGNNSRRLQQILPSSDIFCASTHQTGSQSCKSMVWVRRTVQVPLNPTRHIGTKSPQSHPTPSAKVWTKMNIRLRSLTRFLKGDIVTPIKPSSTVTSAVCHLTHLSGNKVNSATKEGTASGGWVWIKASVLSSYPPWSVQLLFKHHPDVRTVSNAHYTHFCVCCSCTATWSPMQRHWKKLDIRPTRF